MHVAQFKDCRYSEVQWREVDSVIHISSGILFFPCQLNDSLSLSIAKIRLCLSVTVCQMCHFFNRTTPHVTLVIDIV